MIWNTPTPLSSRRENALAAHILETVPRACAQGALASQFRVAEAAQGVAAYLAMPENAEVGALPDTARLCELLAAALEASGDRALACRIRAFGSAVVYAGQWHAAPGVTVWVLNVGRLIDPGESGMELLLFERLRQLIDSMADVWDAAAGHGILGLRDLRSAARRLVPPNARASRIETAADTLRGFCGDRLEVLRHQRRWAVAPVVMCLHS